MMEKKITEVDLGVYLIEHLMDDSRCDDGALIQVNHILEAYRHNHTDGSPMTRLSMSNTILEIIKEGYLKEAGSEKMGLYNYGMPSHKDHKGDVGYQSVILGVTWKGRFFYNDRIKKGGA